MDVTRTKSVAQTEDAGIVVHIKDEKGDYEYYENGTGPKPVTIKVAGSYSSRARRAQEKNRDSAYRRRLDRSEYDEMSLGVLVSCILEWDGFTANGQPYPLTRENAFALLESAPWIREQLETAHNDHASFFKGA